MDVNYLLDSIEREINIATADGAISFAVSTRAADRLRQVREAVNSLFTQNHMLREQCAEMRKTIDDVRNASSRMGDERRRQQRWNAMSFAEGDVDKAKRILAFLDGTDS